MPFELLLLMPPNTGQRWRQLSELLLCVLLSETWGVSRMCHLVGYFGRNPVDLTALCFSCNHQPLVSQVVAQSTDRQAGHRCLVCGECTGCDLPSFYWCSNLPVSWSCVLSCFWLPLLPSGISLHYSHFQEQCLVVAPCICAGSCVLLSSRPTMFSLFTIPQRFRPVKVLLLFWLQLGIHLTIFSCRFRDLI